MSYALWDRQTGNYMATGYGAKTLKQVKDSLLSYISVDYADDDSDWKRIQRMPVEEIADMWDFEIEQGEFLGEHL